MPEPHVPLEDDLCPVGDQTLGEMYRASAHGLNRLIATIAPGAVLLPPRPSNFDRIGERGNL